MACCFMGFGAAEPFFSQADPAGLLFRAIQLALGVPETGVWDQATHDAFGRFFETRTGQAFPEWGTPGLDVNLFVRAADGMSGPLPEDAVAVATLLGLPSDTFENWNAFVIAHEAEIAAVVAEANRRIDLAERAAISVVSEAKSMVKWWVIGSIAALAVVSVVVLQMGKE
jgi:hypothetical protein